MKNLNSLKAGLAALAVAALLWSAPANAQTHVARIDIPFPFVAGNEMLPAGQYEVVLDEFAHMLLRNPTETTIHFVALSGSYEKRSSANLTPATLRFHRYSGTMFLTAAWAPGHEDGRTVRRSGRLAEAIRASLAANGSASVDIDSGLE